jgi:hypothetical protein
MTVMLPELFPPAEAERFAGDLFTESGDTPPDADAIRRYVAGLYRQFIREWEQGKNNEWDAPLLSFLRSYV